jgi:hypothetical protein
MRIASAAWVCLLILPTVMASAQSPQPASRSARPSAAEPKSERKNETRNVAKSQSKSDAKTKAAAPPVHDPNAGLAPADRVRLELGLAWAGFYTGLISGEPDDKATAAVKAFQKDFKFKETGTLAPSERALVGNLATQKQEQVGWRMVEDAVTGAELGLPTRYVPNSGPGRSGTRWFSAQGQIQVETFRVRGPGTTLADVLEEQKKQGGRQVASSLLRADSFFLSGMQGLKKFAVRADIRDAEVRGIVILYDQATEGVMDPAAVVMASAFAPFPGSGLAALLGQPARRKVEYGSGIVVTATGHVLSDRRLTDGCSIIAVAGLGNAERLAEDRASDLALLRVYGAPDLVPAALVHEGAKGPDLTLVGIADPQVQDGGNRVSTVLARLDGDSILPAPPQGFDGAAAIDGRGRLYGMVALKEAVTASSGSTSAPREARAVPVEMLRKFLDSQNVAPATGRAGLEAAKAALVRLICVRR